MSILVNSVCRYVTFLTLAYTYILSCITWLVYPLSYNLTGSIVLTSSCSSYRSCLSNWHICVTRSIILSPPSLTFSLRIFSISRLFTKGVVFFNLICCHLPLMPPSVASVCYTAFIAFILSISKIMPSCSYYVKKRLVYVIIMALSSH